MTLLELFRHRSVDAYMKKDTHYKNWVGDMPVVSPELIVGLELEIENFGEYDEPPFGCNITEDGSLRNNGREVITLPTKVKYLQRVLENVFKKHEIHEDNYSDRCSTHVHVNVQDFTVDQLKNITLVYQVVERLLYKWVGEDREGNIYCVPWYQTNLNQNLVSKLTDSSARACANWVKYTALNLIPVREQGTLEFRHLYGTCDVAVIMKWVNIISSMVEYARRQEHAALAECILNMNTVSNYDVFLRDVFGANTELFTSLPDYKAVLGIGVVDTKLMLMKPPPPPPRDPNETQTLAREYIRVYNRQLATLPGEGLAEYIGRIAPFHQQLRENAFGGAQVPGTLAMWEAQQAQTMPPAADVAEPLPAPVAPREMNTRRTPGGGVRTTVPTTEWQNYWDTVQNTAPVFRYNEVATTPQQPLNNARGIVDALRQGRLLREAARDARERAEQDPALAPGVDPTLPF